MTACFQGPQHPCTNPNCRLQCPTLISINTLDQSSIWIGYKHRRCLTCPSTSTPVTRTIIILSIVKLLGTITPFSLCLSLSLRSCVFLVPVTLRFTSIKGKKWLQRVSIPGKVTVDVIQRDRVLRVNNSKTSCLYHQDGRLTSPSGAGSITSITIPRPRTGLIRSRRRACLQDGRESNRPSMAFIMSSK